MLLFWGGASQGFVQLDTLIVSEFDRLFKQFSSGMTNVA
jgi:hypothetical protein